MTIDRYAIFWLCSAVRQQHLQHAPADRDASAWTAVLGSPLPPESSLPQTEVLLTWVDCIKLIRLPFSGLYQVASECIHSCANSCISHIALKTKHS